MVLNFIRGELPLSMKTMKSCLAPNLLQLSAGRIRQRRMISTQIQHISTSESCLLRVFGRCHRRQDDDAYEHSIVDGQTRSVLNLYIINRISHLRQLWQCCNTAMTLRPRPLALALSSIAHRPTPMAQVQWMIRRLQAPVG